MKRLFALMGLLAIVVIHGYAQHFKFDAKYVTVGVASNQWPAVIANNPNIRRIGDYSIPPQADEKYFNDHNIGKLILDNLLQRDESGLHMDKLYEQALQNTTAEEIEVAKKDISADAMDILKREVAHQLLKNNYILVFYDEIKVKKNGKEKHKEYWSLYHVGIDDKVIEQAYLNWQTPNTYDQIKVPVKFVAKGKVPINSFDDKELLYDIAKKVPAFAVRGPLVSRIPFVARFGESMGVKNRSRIFVYRIKEDSKGNVYSKKICTTRATDVGTDNSRMVMISGNFPSTKKGDIAVLRDRHKSSFSILGQASFGNDARIGGRLEYDYLTHISKGGVAQYFITNVGYSRYDKDPDGIWWDGDKTIQPRLNNLNISLGYGVGFNFLGRFELRPYLLAGYQYSFLTGGNSNVIYWDNDYQYPRDDKVGNWLSLVVDYQHAIITHGGVKLNMNLWYPLQLSVGVDYNIDIDVTPYESVRTSLVVRPGALTEHHTTDRLNLYAGFRLNF